MSHAQSQTSNQTSTGHGPEAVAKEAPDRIVAIIDGKPFTAKQAWNMLSLVNQTVRQERGGKLTQLLQQLYMQHAIADEATKMHLDRQAPWTTQLTQAYGATIGRFPPPRRDVPPRVTAQWNNDRERILWRAYFSKAATPEERQALLKQKREQYAIDVKDSDFFRDSN